MKGKVVMARKITKQRQADLIRDIFNANHDVVALAEAHSLSPADLAEWIAQPHNQRCLSGLCVLADLQTQLMLSRYRLVAVTKLIQQATQQEEVTAEQARKACSDLLKLDLKRAGLDEAASAAETAGDAPLDAQQLQQMLYGDAPSDVGRSR
jgi:hypothetical protein